MVLELEPCDVFLNRGNAFISSAIRVFTRTIGESRTQVNHAGIIVKGGDIHKCVAVESLLRVKQHPLWSRYGNKPETDVSVFRPINLTDEEKKIISSEACEQVGKHYGFLKLATHLLDWVLLGAFFFRRLTQNENYPICSWLVAHAFAKAGKNFGVAPGAATPDDIWDFVASEPGKYRQVHPLKPLAG